MARDAEKKPVLTSPWKIGALVALLLVMTGIGVAYYFVDVYGVSFSWLRPSQVFPGFGLDSFAFFREMYPLVAAVIGLSLVSYFVIASAVRRYRSYLSSGQDYRKMVSLADSIDDLTNPAQIAKLSDFPELQDVLRNYGDRIREISRALEEKERESKSIDLEMEIDSLLRGEPVDDSNIEGRWWAPIFRRVQEHIESAGDGEDARGEEEGARRIAGRMLLSAGKVLEEIGGAKGDIDGIACAAGELDGPAATGAAIDARVLDEMMETVRRIGQGGAVLGEFSEETNGIALNLALMATRGSVDEHELASFAEKARATAERFRRLEATFTGLAKGMLGELERARSSGGAGTASADDAVATIVRRIEEMGMSLRNRFDAVTGEMKEVDRLVKDWMGEPTNGNRSDAASFADENEDGRLDVVDYGAGEPGMESEADLVIDHGESWQNIGGIAQMFAGGDEPRNEDAPASGAVESEAPIFEEPSNDGPGSADPVSFNEICLERRDMTPGTEPAAEPARETSGAATAATGIPGPSEPAAGPMPEEQPVFAPIARDEKTAGAGEGWMEMPDRGRVRVDVEADGAPTWEIPVAETPASRPVSEPAPPAIDERTVDDEDPVYDLFELGAVEYVEETQTQR